VAALEVSSKGIHKRHREGMNNALDIRKSEGMNVAHLQGGNLEDGMLDNTGGSAVETISCSGTVEQV
jgi:hypothetical protein